MDFLTSTSSSSSIFTIDHLEEFFQLFPIESLIEQEDVTPNSLQQEVVVGGPADPVVAETCQSPKDNNTNTDKKLIHRDMERVRRQGMASLHSSLRSHLPLELLKGKRSVSDHIHQSVNYIRHQQNKIRALSEKRDEMKRSMELRADQTDSGEISETCHDPRYMVVINPCMEGVEIMINTCWMQGIPLSKILRVLMRGGLDVTHSNSTRMNERVIYSIQAEIEDRGNLNLAELHQKLMSLRA